MSTFFKLCGALGFALLSVTACAERGAGLHWDISPQQLRAEFDKVALVGDDPRLGVYERTLENGDIFYLAIVKIDGNKAIVSYGTSIPPTPVGISSHEGEFTTPKNLRYWDWTRKKWRYAEFPSGRHSVIRSGTSPGKGVLLYRIRLPKSEP